MTLSLRIWLWCLLSLAPQQAPAPPAVKPPTGLIVGQVTDAATNRPVPGAIVTIGAPASRRVLVDDAGRFLFRDLPKASYSLTAAAPGYLDGAFGQKGIGGPAQPFALAEDQKVGDVIIKLWREASIAGSITDEIGSPVTGIYVSLVRREVGSVGKAAVFSSAGVVRTDNRGAYQFSTLTPGDYLVAVTNKITALPVGTPADQATTQGLTESGSMSLSQMGRSSSPVVRIGDFLLVSSGSGGISGGTNLLSSQLPLSPAAGATGVDKVVAYPTMYYPGALTPFQATAITLAAGADRSDINLRLTPAAMTRVSGTLMGPDGPLTRFAVHLIPAYAANSYLERADEVGVTATDAKAAFTFMAVPPGQYVVRAWRLPMSGLTDREIVPDTSLWGQTTVTVGSDPVPGVVLTLRPGGTIGGKVIFEGTGTPPNTATYPNLIGRLFAPGWPSAIQEGIGVRARVTASGEFLSAGLPPGLYSATPDTLPAGVGRFLESVTLEGKDLFITPVRIDGQNVTGVVVTFTDRTTQLSGRIQDSAGKADPAASVVIFPADYRTWIQNGLLPQAARVVTASQAGTYSVPDIRPGEYLVAAVGEAALANWQQAPTIESLAPLATRVTLVRGDTKQVDLKTVRR